MSALAFVFVLSFPYFERTHNANELPRLLQGMAVIDTGEAAIDGVAARGIAPGPDVARSDKDGRLYPNKPPATSLVAAAAYVFVRIGATVTDEPPTLRAYTYIARLLGAVLPSILLAGWLLRRYGGQFGFATAGLAVTTWILATPAASYGHLLYGHSLTAVVLVAGAALICDAHDRGRVSRAVVGGALAGSAVAFEYGAVFAGIPIAGMLGWALVHGRARATVVASACAAAVPVAALALYHHLVFGSPFLTGYHRVTNAVFAEKHAQGLLGLGLPTFGGFYGHFLAPDGGLLWWAPLVPLALWGLGRAATEVAPHRTEARLFLAVFLLFMVLTTGLSFEGGWRVGPRYLVLALPMLVLGWARAFVELRRWRRWAIGGVLALGTYSLIVNRLAADLWPHFDLAHVHQPVGEVLLPLVLDAREPYGLPWLLGIGHTAEIGVAAAGALWIALLRRAAVARRTWGVVPVALLLGIALVAATWMMPQHPRGPANLAWIRGVWEPDPRGAGPSLQLRSITELRAKPRATPSPLPADSRRP